MIPSRMRETEVNRFDSLAAEWDANPTRVELAGAVAAAILTHARPERSARVLDYGAGTGLVSLQLSRHASEVVAVDSSREMLRGLESKLAASGIPNVKTCAADFEREPASLGMFDLVVSSMTLHHVRAPGPLLGRFQQILRPGGRLALADLDPEEGFFHGRPEDAFHPGFARAELGQWLADAGFGSINFHTAHRLAKKGSDDREREYTVFLAVAGRL